MEDLIPKGMEKPPLLKEYDDIADPVDHVDGFEVTLHYHNVGGPIKCSLFPRTLRKTTMDWYKNLSLGRSPPRGSSKTNSSATSLHLVDI